MIAINEELRARAVLDMCKKAGLRVSTAESCTGGLIAACLTDISGSSEVFECGFVTYSNRSKAKLLGVPMALIEAEGAVSEKVACAMAEGALVYSYADVAVAVTGVAGPGGGSETKPVGLVHLAAARKGRSTIHQRVLFPGDRAAVRAATVAMALDMIELIVTAFP